MIVPFLFVLDEYSKEKPTHLWIANKFYDFCYKNSFPIILQEKYTKSPMYYINKGHTAMGDEMQKKFNFRVLNEKDFFEIDKLIITKEEEKRILSKYKTKDEATVKLLKEENKEFEKIIEEKINQILQNSKEKIEAIITWIWYPSLEKIANKYNIKVLNYEISTIRPGKYRDILGYFKIGDKYDNKKILEEYSKFKYDPKKMLLLNNKELVNLLIDDEHIVFINEMDKNSEYEVGLALGLKKDFFAQAYDGKSYDQILEKIEQFIPQKKISLRSHPAMPFDESKSKYSFDHSFESIEWITKCKNIVCSVSNIGYEAILFNRGVISTNDCMITSFGKASSLEYCDPQYYGLLELNFLTFVYYAPYELMFDLEYIRFRLKENDLYKVYDYNQNYILKKYKLNSNILKKMSLEERFIQILNTHNISNEEKNKIINDAFEVNRYNELDREKDKLILEQKKTLETILNSKGWKLLEKLRKIKPGK